MCSLSVTTLTDVIMCFYMFTQASYNPLLGIIFIVDVFICSLNVYCLLCVSSRYQELSLELYTTKFEEDRRAISLRHQGSIKVRTTDSSLNKSTALIDDGSSLGIYLLPSSQRKGSTSPKSQLLTELSTISEERSFSNFNRKPSTDVSSVNLDSQMLSPSTCKRPFSVNSSSPTHSIELYSEIGSENKNECLSFSTKDGHLCPRNTGNGPVYCSQFELVTFSISEEPTESHL
ncbi:uncharacterized protein LOC111089142 [Limulus polyphemus]|uniref:Uncharacterized protein LOC111089142 n=1 Tax=Limulus polyphemus TaxID=6850 RepID=A0ABM1TLL1_LIMPO|nr:uncharacterized protein LOC111089142 [Limulus polyphemus]